MVLKNLLTAARRTLSVAWCAGSASRFRSTAPLCKSVLILRIEFIRKFFMEKTFRTPSETETIMTQVVQPNDTNPLGSLHGGTLMYWMDECSAIAATKHSRAVVVTVSVDGVSFSKAIE